MVQEAAICCWKNDANDKIFWECHSEEFELTHFSNLGPRENFPLFFFVRDCAIGLATANWWDYPFPNTQLFWRWCPSIFRCWLIVIINRDSLTTKVSNILGGSWMRWNILLHIVEGATIFIFCIWWSNCSWQICCSALGLKNNCRRQFNFEIWSYDVEDVINSRNVTKIAALLDVTNNLCTIPDDSNIIKAPCLVVIGELAADVLAGVKEFGKSRANSTDATSMRLPHHCCFFCGCLWFDSGMYYADSYCENLLVMFVAFFFPLTMNKIPNLHCANFNNLGPTVAIELATDIWHKHT